MNRLGMMVDISHVSDRTFYRTLIITRAPVIASHSAARALSDAPRNMTDDMLRAVANSGGPGSKGGVVQVNFYSAFISQQYRDAQKAMQPEVDKAVQALKDKYKAERERSHRTKRSKNCSASTPIAFRVRRSLCSSTTSTTSPRLPASITSVWAPTSMA